ncbi:hypothetical protein BAUCODRAFT_23481 [Baudoinia panamericana UAMH 10762]|uniref:Uncharacterized protein n=1 Tax=Baudoinia panamericana (strain UAMH 10762) TaxID=717646 RepID=M2MK84_BAUPA|nr:uncharacterized protein BAUCODRAFT_23481 [Baudoinia panamericana UAMH 10762]EMC97101.1 hypothetical protein BAUCODRAFT_23481 [Baudoinia panamericana UAMH 10762]
MSRYAASHVSTQGPGDARPTALQIVEDEGLTGKLVDKVFLVTGVSSGIGIETLRALYATGAHVYGTVRDMDKGEEVVRDIKAKGQGGEITLIPMEMDSLASIKKGAEQFLSQSKQLNGLIGNAGGSVMATPYGKTQDGFETQFGTNHIGHFYLFQLLKHALLDSSTPEFPSRVVSVSSMGHRCGEVRFDDYNFEDPDTYEAWTAYGQAKTANIYFANEIERRYGARGLHATSLHPGGIATALQRHLDPELLKGWANDEITRYMKSPEQGAATTVYAALSKEWANKGGKYLSNCVEQPAFDAPDGPLSLKSDGYERWAYDEEKASRLWRDSLRMVGLEDEA